MIILEKLDAFRFGNIVGSNSLGYLNINGDMGWLSPEHRQWMCVARKMYRLVDLDESLLASKIFQTYLLNAMQIAKHGVLE